jgi:hypothetical protein
MNSSGFVTVNGIVQSSSDYYIDDNDRLIFNQAPSAGDNINVVFSQGEVNGPVLVFNGNGTQNVFVVEGNTELLKFNRLMNDIRKHKDKPVVKDLLEQLQIVTELLR